jgi:hypothetical protein
MMETELVPEMMWIGKKLKMKNKNQNNNPNYCYISLRP